MKSGRTMGTTRTTISLPDELLREIDGRASSCSLSRSAFIIEALERHMSELRESELRRAIDEAYTEPETPEELADRRAFQRASARALAREPW